MNDEILIDVAKIRERTRQQWLAEQRRKATFLDQIDQSVPWWLVVIAATLFALSAPHTAATFAQITPIMGLLAPLFVEFGLLYTAFSRKKLRQQGEKIPGLIWVTEILLFITAIIVNGAGAFVSVVTAVGLGEMSFADMIEAFGEMPATSQVALILVPIAAFIIPIGTMVAGEGLATLVLERKRAKDDQDEQWIAASPRWLYTAFFDALIAAGYQPGKARQLAAAYATQKTEKTKDMDASKEDERPQKDTKGQPADSNSPSEGQPMRTTEDSPDSEKRTRNPNALADALRLLNENPDWHGLSLRVLEGQTGISKSVWDKAKKTAVLVRSNGHLEHETE